jgi:hypothetical protein
VFLVRFSGILCSLSPALPNLFQVIVEIHFAFFINDAAANEPECLLLSSFFTSVYCVCIMINAHPCNALHLARLLVFKQINDWGENLNTLVHFGTATPMNTLFHFCRPFCLSLSVSVSLLQIMVFLPDKFFKLV